MPDPTGAPPTVTAFLTHLAGLPPVTQIMLTTTTILTAIMLIVWREYRRRTRTTPTLRARAGRALTAGWKALRTPATPEQKDRRGDRIELLLVTFFVAVVAGLIMRGLIDFARDSMGLEGVWPYLLFAAFDGAAGLFAFASYRWALKHGASPLFPRLMVGLVLGASAWFQWTHATAAGHPVAGQVAWAALPAIGAVLWEFVLRQRMKAWKKAQPPSTEQIPTPRLLLAPIQSTRMKRRMVLWGIDSFDEAVDLHVTRVQCMRMLRREFGLFWAWRVPADVAYLLKEGVRIPEAAAKVPGIIEAHRREVENRRLVKEAERAARAVSAPTPGVYTVSIPEAPVLDLGPVPGVVDVVEPLEPAPAMEPAKWVDPSDEWDPLPENDEDEWETPTLPPDEEPTTDSWEENPTDPWENAPPATAPFTPLNITPTVPGGTQITPIPTPQRTPAGYTPAPRKDTPEFEAAVKTYITSVNAGKPLSGRELCRAYNVNPNNKDWRQLVVRTAKERMAAEQHALF